MKRIEDILDNYYFPKRKSEILLALEPYGFIKILNSAINSIESINLIGIPENVNVATTNAIITPVFISINEIIGKIKNHQKKSDLKKIVLELVIKILFNETSSLLNNFSKNQFLEIIEGICLENKYDFNDFKENFDIVDAIRQIEDNSGKSISDKQKVLKEGNIKWNSNENSKRELIDILRRTRWILNANVLRKLLDNPNVKIQLICDEFYLNEIALLWYMLKEEGYISSKPTRGYYKILNSCCVNKKKEQLRDGILKEKTNRIVKNKDKNKILIDKISRMITDISKRSYN